jgi:hypothetical protein
MEQEKNKRNFKKPLLMVGVFLLIASLIANGLLGWGYLKGYSKVGAVCGRSDIDKINKILAYDKQEYTEDSMTKFVKDIKSRDSYDEDPNCISIIFATALGNKKMLSLNEHESLLAKYKKLSEAGINPSVKINDINTISAVSRVIEVVKNE